MKLFVITLTCIAFLSCTKTGTTPTTPTVSDALITGAIASGTSAGLKLAIKDHDRQVLVAKYLNNYAGALRTIVGNPTSDQLTQQLMAFIPANVSQQYPELGSFAVPMIVSFYNVAQQKYGNDTAQFQKYLNDVATGIETGSACCLK